MKRIIFFVLFLLIFSSAFAQTVKIKPVPFEDDKEYFLGGCGLKYAEQDYRYLDPTVKVLIDSGIVNFSPRQFKVVISPQADGTKQQDKYEASQLLGINQKMQNLRFAFLKSYLTDSLGYEVEFGEYRFAVEQGARYRGAWLKFVQKDDVVETMSPVINNTASALFLQEKILGVEFRVNFFLISVADTTRWIDCRALLVSNMGLLESDSITYELSHKDAGSVDQQGRFRSAGKPGVFTIIAKYREYSDFCSIVVEGVKSQPETPKASSIVERVDVLGFVNNNSAAGAGVMMQFNSRLLFGVTNSVKRWDGKSENLLNPFVGYGFYALSNMRIALLAGPAWHTELDDNQFDAIGPVGGIHADLQVGRVSVFSQLLAAKFFEHQHGKTSPSRLYQDPNDPNTIGVKNEIIRPDLKHWRNPELIGRVGLSIQL